MKMRSYDKPMLWIVCVLVVAGFFILSSASLGFLNKNGSDFYYGIVFKQIGFGLFGGAVLFFITSRIHYRNWKKYALPFFLVSLILTLLVFESHIGFEHGGAKRWIKIGSFFFQPSELLKFGFIVYLSSWIASRRNDIKSFKFGLLPFLLITGFAGATLIFEPDIGTLGVMAISGLFLFFIGGSRLRQIAMIVLIGIALLFMLAQFKPHLMSRITVFLNPSFDPQGAGYQIRQSLISVGSGEFFGRGFGMSVQKFKYLPEPMGDSIFAVVGEEFGFFGSALLIGLFLLFMYRGFYISFRAPDIFARLLGSGIVILIIVQSFINIGATIGVLPFTGLPLLFVSQGGSALIVALAEVGVLLNISKYI